jgi:hypothetical protein
MLSAKGQQLNRVENENWMAESPMSEGWLSHSPHF